MKRAGRCAQKLQLLISSVYVFCKNKTFAKYRFPIFYCIKTLVLYTISGGICQICLLLLHVVTNLYRLGRVNRFELFRILNADSCVVLVIRFLYLLFTFT